MLSFDLQLENFVHTIEHGPGALNPALFDGPIDRVMLGLKAHANTISHARLVALEQTFPRTRNALGDSEFNVLSRVYCATECARSSVPNSIGEGFGQFLQTCLNDAAILDLCRIEWAWLECYHAPDTPALALADLAVIDADALLALQIARHPAASMIALNARISPELSEFADETSTPAILITRQSNAVILTALTNLDRDIFCAAKISANIGNLLHLGIEQADEQAALESVMRLMGAGALVKTGLKNAEVDPTI
jgi:hypothetical protein